MRFYNLVAILALGGVSAQVADDEGARNLRGAEPDEIDVEGRDLLVTASAGSYSKSATVTLHQCFKQATCVPVYEKCWAVAFSFACSVAGGSYAEADAEFFADAYCMAMAEAEASSFACVYAKGKIDLQADRSSRLGMDFTLWAKLKSATITIAKASSEAKAKALAGTEGGVFTIAESDYCNGVGKTTFYCDPSQAKAIGAAEASSFGDAFALAEAGAASGSGTNTYVSGFIKASGSSISKIFGLFTSVAKSFSWASAYTKAMAQAYASASTDAVAFAKSCEQAYDTHCGCSSCGGKCKWKNKEEACSEAVAFGAAAAETCAGAVAESAAKAAADASVFLSFGGTLTNCQNDGQPLDLEWADGGAIGSVSCGLICKNPN